jgi:hypothetical protein
MIAPRGKVTNAVANHFLSYQFNPTREKPAWIGQFLVVHRFREVHRSVRADLASDVAILQWQQ